MDKYKAKPVKVEAVQLSPDSENAREICDWINYPNNESGRSESFACVYGWETSTPQDPPLLEVLAYNGMTRVKPGQWVVKQPNGKFSVLPDYIFNARYEMLANEKD